jgi:hypothetical protein
MKQVNKIAAIISATLLSALSTISASAVAQTPAPITAADLTAPVSLKKPSDGTEKKQIFALVSAVGDQFTYVRQKESTGSNIIDNNIRRTVKVDNNSLNMAVLRGLDAGITAAHPESEKVYIALSAAEMKNVLPQNREAVAIGKIVTELEKRPERATWDKIIVATPKYLQSERQGMGPKLHGLGVYVQPLTGGSIQDLETGAEIDVSQQGESDTTNPEDGKKNKSKLYVAPYSYIQLYVIDPKTMKVVEKIARHDYIKLNDPNSTALDVGKSIPIDVLATRMSTLIERSAARAVGQTEIGVAVTITEVKPEAAKPETKK